MVGSLRISSYLFSFDPLMVIYRHQIGSVYEPLDRRIEAELVQRNRWQGLVHGCLPIVMRMARRISFLRGVCDSNLLDLIQDANLRLVAVAKSGRFDPTCGNSFSGYAHKDLKGAIHRGIEQSRLIRIPANILRDRRLYCEAKAKLQEEGIEEPSSLEIAQKMAELYRVNVYAKISARFLKKALPCTVEQIEREVEKKVAQDRPFLPSRANDVKASFKIPDELQTLDDTVNIKGRESRDTLGATLVDTKEETCDQLEQRIDTLDLLKRWLTDLQYEVVIRRFGFDGNGGRELEEIADEIYEARKLDLTSAQDIFDGAILKLLEEENKPLFHAITNPEIREIIDHLPVMRLCLDDNHYKVLVKFFGLDGKGLSTFGKIVSHVNSRRKNKITNDQARQFLQKALEILSRSSYKEIVEKLQCQEVKNKLATLPKLKMVLTEDEYDLISGCFGFTGFGQMKLIEVIENINSKRTLTRQAVEQCLDRALKVLGEDDKKAVLEEILAA